MNKLTKREKIMIYIMVLVAILGISFLLIRPALKQRTQLQTEYEDVCMQRDILQMTMLDPDIVNKQLSDQLIKHEALTGKLPEVVGCDEMEQELVQIIADNGLAPIGTVLTQGYPVSIPLSEDNLDDVQTDNETKDVSADGDLLGESVSETANEDILTSDDVSLDGDISLEAEETDYTSYVNYYSGGLTVSVMGTMSSLMNFMDACSAKLPVSVSSVSITGENNANLASDYGTTYSFYIELQYNMMPSFEQYDVLQYDMNSTQEQ